MSKPLILFLATAFLSMIGPAVQASPQGERPSRANCMQSARNQLEMTTCAATLAKEADDRLNAAYRDLLRYLDGDGRAKLVSAQRAWIVFRDKDCAFVSSGGGSISPMNDALCRAGHTENRIRDLTKWPPNADRSALKPLR